MKYLKQFFIIMSFAFVGDVLNKILPLPIPGSIYGIVLLFACLQFKIIQVSQIKETGKFLVEIMPIMFVPAAVGLLEVWPILQQNLISYLIIIILSTILVMGIAGKVVEWMVKKL